MTNDNITVEYIGNSENRLHNVCCINGREIYIPKRLDAFKSCELLLKDCILIKDALKSRGDIMQFINKYGGLCAYAIMETIAPEALTNYFKAIAEDKIQNREPIYPRKIMKAYKLNNVIDRNPDNKIIAMLEGYSESLINIYPQFNEREIEKNDYWRLYYTQQNSLRYINFNFECFGNGKLRNEVLSLLKAYFEFNTVDSLYRLYKDLKTAFDIMSCKNRCWN